MPFGAGDGDVVAAAPVDDESASPAPEALAVAVDATRRGRHAARILEAPRAEWRNVREQQRDNPTANALDACIVRAGA